MFRIMDALVRNRALSPATALAFMALAMGFSGKAFAGFDLSDLESEIEDAGDGVTSVVKTGLGIVSGVIVVVGLGRAAKKFSDKDPDAIMSLLGAVGAAAVLAIAAAAL